MLPVSLLVAPVADPTIADHPWQGISDLYTQATVQHPVQERPAEAVLVAVEYLALRLDLSELLRQVQPIVVAKESARIDL